MMEEKEKLCYNCRFCAAFDSGYSNYTVEETELHCLYGVNPLFPIEESYSWQYGDSKTKDNEAFKVAQTCPLYEFSEDIVRIDVEREQVDSYKDDPLVYALLNKAL